MPGRDSAIFVRLTAEEYAALEAFSAAQEPRPSLSETLRRLALHGLAEAKAGRVQIAWEGRRAASIRAVGMRKDRRGRT